MWKIPAETEVAPRYTYTLLTLLTLFALFTYTVYTIKTDLHCSNNSIFTYIYCQGQLARYWNGLMRDKQNVGVGDWMDGWMDTP